MDSSKSGGEEEEMIRRLLAVENVDQPTKARNELGSDEVKAKAAAGALWCKHASAHAGAAGAKPWKYLLIPQDQVTEDKRLSDFFVLEVDQGLVT